MLRTFNCGLGMCMIVSSKHVDEVLLRCNAALSPFKLHAYKVGKLVSRQKQNERIRIDNLKEAMNSSYEKVRTSVEVLCFAKAIR